MDRVGSCPHYAQHAGILGGVVGVGKGRKVQLGRGVCGFDGLSVSFWPRKDPDRYCRHTQDTAFVCVCVGACTFCSSASFS